MSFVISDAFEDLRERRKEVSLKQDQNQHHRAQVCPLSTVCAVYSAGN